MPGAGRKGLTALIAAAGLYQIIDWARSGAKRLGGAQTKPLRDAHAGEIRLQTEADLWKLVADLKLEQAWVLVEGPGFAQAAASQPGESPLVFKMPPGQRGTYRFWLMESRSKQETTRSLGKKLARAIAAGEFHY